ncbi:MAG: hypothetical protein U0V49_05555 [Saprospiraceae bacterium]
MNAPFNMTLKLTLVFCLLSYNYIIFGQELRYDDNWLIGYDGSDGHTRFNFKQNNLNIDVFNSRMEIDENLAMSDKDGNLLFYTNGCQIFNNKHRLMTNGDSLIVNGWGQYCEKNLSLPFSQGMLVIPSSLHDDKYFLIHPNTGIFTINGELSFGVTEYYYSEIDFDPEHLDGIVHKKGKSIIQGAFEGYGIDMCRHANGRDWWIVIPDYGFNCLNLVLFRNDSFYNYRHQCITSDNLWAFGSGVKKFSPNRCSGKFSYRENVTFDEINTLSSECEFSSDSRFLYVSNIDSLWQLDLSASPISSSKLLIDTWDQAIPRSRFGSMQRAPDGKIYVASRGTSVYYHVINHPEKKGKDCEFEQRAITLPTYYYYYIPSYPNYNLGADSSICFPNGVINPNERDCGITVHQLNNRIIVSTEAMDMSKDLKFFITNSFGQNIHFNKSQISDTSFEINLDFDQKGLFFLTGYSKSCGFQSLKFFRD